MLFEVGTPWETISPSLTSESAATLVLCIVHSTLAFGGAESVACRTLISSRSTVPASELDPSWLAATAAAGCLGGGGGIAVVDLKGGPAAGLGPVLGARVRWGCWAAVRVAAVAATAAAAKAAAR